ncbi:MAG: type 4a pilus biogenesis protein PilO [Planctomycetota bacterium]
METSQAERQRSPDLIGTARQKLLISILVILIILIGLAYFTYLPKVQQLLNLRAEARNLEQKLDAKREALSLYVAVNDKLKGLEANYQQLQLKFPASQEVPQVLNKLVSAADSLNLEIVSIIPQPSVVANIYQTVPVEVNINGSYQSLANFFNKLNLLPWLVTVDKFEVFPLNAGETKTQPPKQMTLKLMLNIITYSLLPGESGK